MPTLFDIESLIDLSWVESVWNSVKPLIFIIGGVEIGFYIIEGIIGFFRKDRGIEVKREEKPII